MLLTDNSPIAFIPIRNAQAARLFYEKTLGLTFVTDDSFAMVFALGVAPQTMLRLVRMGDFSPASYTVFGWAVDDLEQAVDELATNGITFLRFSYFEQDPRGIWKAPDGSQVAWFKDPDGNTLSLSRHR